ncbi:MAG: hypothetical protein JWN58_1303, partial [Gammaproteobacteria bacterium]|nr:hypothetical protein [Gammaproteobacteria bacterium]
MAAAITDEASEPQLSRSLRNAFPPYAEQAGNQFLRYDQLARGDSIERAEQPAAQLLLHEVMSVASGVLCHLCDQRLCVAKQQAAGWTAKIKFLL